MSIVLLDVPPEICVHKVTERTAAKHGSHLPALTGVRFVLALWVILHHLTGKGKMLDPWFRTLPDTVQTIGHSGYLAVGTFFVLSGFVLARSYERTTWSGRNLVRYGIARCARVYPVYLFSLVLLAPIIADQLLAGSGPMSIANKGAMLFNYGFVLQGWVVPQVNWNTPAWSLSCELFFYACFPFLLFPLRNSVRLGLAGAVAAALALPVAVQAFAVPAAWKPVIHLSDFMAGIAAASLYRLLTAPGSRWISRGYILYLPAAAALLFLTALPRILGSWLVFDMSLRVANFTLLVGLALGGGLPARALSTRISQFLGRASYSMYILHIPLLWWFKRSWVYESAGLPAAGMAAVYLVGVVGVSALVFHHIEEPANRGIRSLATLKIKDNCP